MNIVIYDDQCPLCSAQVRFLKRLDWLKQLEFVPQSDPSLKESFPKISQGDLQLAIHCITKNGRVYRAARCLRFVGMRIPLLFPFALLLWIPGLIQLAEIGYRGISRNRLVLSRVFGCKGACSLSARREH